MTGTAAPSISVAALFAEREERRRRERDAEQQLKRRNQEQFADFRKRLDDFQITEERVNAVMHRIREAFDRGETELLLTSFPSSFCTDGGRAVNNADLPPINTPPRPKDGSTPPEPGWLATLPLGVRRVYEHWRHELQPGGFHLGARIISYPGGKPGDVGLFLSWPKNPPEETA